MTTPLPNRSTRFTPEQGEILGQVYSLILSWRRERIKMETNSQAGTPPSSLSEATPPSAPQTAGGSDE